MDLISVIVPVYNVAPYLRRCLDSIISQTHHNLEIILINDGSSDDSGQICDEYAQRDKRIAAIHQTNKGVSAARNYGLDLSHGSYVSFVDADDIIEPTLFERLLHDIHTYHCDISCCMLDVINIDGSQQHTHSRPSTLMTGKDVIGKYFSDQFIKDQMYSPCNKLYAQNLIDGIRFKPYHLGEDILFIFELLTRCNKIYLDSYIGYHYMHREGSAMTSSFSAKRLDYIYAAREIETMCKTMDSEIQEQVHLWVYQHVLITLRQIIMSQKEIEFNDFMVQEKKYLRLNCQLLKKLGWQRYLDYIGVMYLPLYFDFLKYIKK